RSPGRPAHDHAPRQGRSGLVQGDARRPAAPRRPHEGGRALHDGALRRVRRPGRRVSALAVALRLLADELEVARRVLERSEAAGRRARPPRPLRHAPDGGNPSRGADQAADRKGAEPAAGRVDVHATIVLVRITTLGDLLLDVVVRLEQPLVPGDDQVAVTRTGAGGQAANVAAWAASLGANARY